mmetsp:Transcript_8928/g.22102  ORF Transcript_8928/g.22102 Transcript_8928/m.22102 type:complete len:139 (-) Transcript_8928:1093-1509(-)
MYDHLKCSCDDIRSAEENELLAWSIVQGLSYIASLTDVSVSSSRSSYWKMLDHYSCLIHESFTWGHSHFGQMYGAPHLLRIVFPNPRPLFCCPADDYQPTRERSRHRCAQASLQHPLYLQAVSFVHPSLGWWFGFSQA